MPVMKNIFKNLKLKIEQSKSSNKELKLQKEKYRYVTILRLLSIFILGILIAIVFGTAFFVYRAVMGTIGQIQSISLYQTELRVEIIDFNKFEKVEKLWETKFSDSEKTLIRNPFIKDLTVKATSTPMLPPVEMMPTVTASTTE